MGPDRGKHLRNIAIILGLTLVVWLVPGGDAAGRTIDNLLGIIFLGGLLFLGYRIYMERKETIFGLEERQRGIFYASVALAAITLVATGRMWEEGGIGAICGSPSSALAAWGLVSTWRAYREY